MSFSTSSNLTHSLIHNLASEQWDIVFRTSRILIADLWADSASLFFFSRLFSSNKSSIVFVTPTIGFIILCIMLLLISPIIASLSISAILSSSLLLSSMFLPINKKSLFSNPSIGFTVASIGNIDPSDLLPSVKKSTSYSSGGE